MKKFIKSLVVAGILLSVATLSSFGYTFTLTVNPLTMVNVLTNFNNPINVTTVILQANTTNASAELIDVPTNLLVYTTPAYSNTISYATNAYNVWTNFYGVVNSNVLTELIDVTNNLVPASTNAYPVRWSGATVASTSATFYNINAIFTQGIWVTNNSSGIATITINY
jgi:hypothetical protein